MQVVTPQLISGKKVLLRMDLDVPLDSARGKPVVVEDYRLRAGLPTLKLCLEHAQEVIVMGHLGRPEGPDPAFSLKPVCEWFNKTLVHLPGVKARTSEGVFSLEQAQSSNAKLLMLENIRFFHGEAEGDLDFAKKLASLGGFFINEAFAAHHPAASTTVLPTLLPHAAGLHFVKEVEILTRVRENSPHPLVAIIGGVKFEDKLPAVQAMAKIADAVLVGGKIASELLLAGPVARQPHDLPTGLTRPGPHHGAPRLASPALPPNVFVGKLKEEGTDLALETVLAWEKIITNAKMIVWNGPLGQVEKPENNQSEKIAQMIIDSGAETIVGGGDTVGFLGRLGMLGRLGFVSTGGGAMLKFLAEGTLPTIEALK